MNIRKFLPIALGLILLVGTPAPTHAFEWTGWTLAGHSITEKDFWDSNLTKTFEGDKESQLAAIKNLSKNNDIMKVELDARGKAKNLTIHTIFTYGPSNFKIYQQKVPNFAEEQQALGNWLVSLIKQTPRDRSLVSAADKLFQDLNKVAKDQPWVTNLQRNLLAARLGIGPEVLEQHPDFESFAKANYLYKHIAYHNHEITVSADGIPEIMVEGVATPWNTLKDQLQIDSKGKLQNHFYTYQGLVSGQPYKVIKPFKQVYPSDYKNQYVLEIVSVTGLPPHNWIRLINPDGDLYSIGLWGETPLVDLVTAAWHLVPETARATSPDLMEIARDPQKMIVTSIKITKEQFDEAMSYLKSYQENPGNYQIVSVSGENCATFVRNLAEHLGINIKSSSWFRPFNNPYDIMEWQKAIAKKYGKDGIIEIN